MIILSEPQDLSMYICVNEEISSKLHQLGIPPSHKFGGNFYFMKTPKLEEIIRKEEIIL